MSWVATVTAAAEEEEEEVAAPLMPLLPLLLPLPLLPLLPSGRASPSLAPRGGEAEGEGEGRIEIDSSTRAVPRSSNESSLARASFSSSADTEYRPALAAEEEAAAAVAAAGAEEAAAAEADWLDDGEEHTDEHA